MGSSGERKLRVRRERGMNRRFDSRGVVRKATQFAEGAGEGRQNSLEEAAEGNAKPERPVARREVQPRPLWAGLSRAS